MSIKEIFIYLFYMLLFMFKLKKRKITITVRVEPSTENENVKDLVVRTIGDRICRCPMNGTAEEKKGLLVFILRNINSDESLDGLDVVLDMQRGIMPSSLKNVFETLVSQYNEGIIP